MRTLGGPTYDVVCRLPENLSHHMPRQRSGPVKPKRSMSGGIRISGLGSVEVITGGYMCIFEAETRTTHRSRKLGVFLVGRVQCTEMPLCEHIEQSVSFRFVKTRSQKEPLRIARKSNRCKCAREDGELRGPGRRS